MRILLINTVPDYVKEKATLPLGLLSIATYLTKFGHTVKIYDRAVDRGSVKKHIKIFSPDMVGISSIGGRSFADAMKVSKIVKNNGIPVAWGGHMPSLIPEVLIKTGFVDYVVMGEGEITMLALIKAITEKTPLREVDGLAFCENGTPVINKEREFADLADLPIIDFTFVDPKKYYFKNMECKRMLHTYISKGCPGQCTYCYSPGYSKCVWRSRPLDYIISELKDLVDHFDMDGVYFVDDLLSPNKEYLYQLCDKLIESHLGLVWSCNMRADTCTKESLQKMYDAGCRWIFFGLETGSAARQKSIKKNLNLKKAQETIDYCYAIGISTTVSFVTGFPDETEEELKETIEYIQGLNAPVKIAGLYGPLPYSEMCNELMQSNRLAKAQTYKEWAKLATMDTIETNFSNVPAKELKVISNYFYYSIFKNKYDYKDAKKHIWVKRLFGQVVDIIKRANLKSIYLVFLSAVDFFRIVFYATMFPKIRKKYGLTYSRKTVK